jgi:FixJ family two-component response regulator
MTSPTQQVFLVDDDPSVRKALERLLRSVGMSIEAHSTAQQYLEHYDPTISGCLVLDIAMPGLSGLELQRLLGGHDDALPIIFLTGCADVPSTVQAMKAGAVDLLSKPVDETVLIEAVRAALERDRENRRSRAELAADLARIELLTPRELEVLRCVVAGMLNKQIAARLGTVEKTIKVHRAHIMEKLRLKSLADLVRLSTKVGIAPTGER